VASAPPAAATLAVTAAVGRQLTTLGPWPRQQAEAAVAAAAVVVRSATNRRSDRAKTSG
jgi:hypothetical protein